MRAHFILYVEDPEASRRFWAQALGRAPVLDVPGMTEFELDGATLGLMPEAGIRRLLGASIPADRPTTGGPARGEIYLRVADAAEAHRRAIAAGARELSPLQPRDWGERVGYSMAPDGYVLAFARANRLSGAVE